MKRFGIGGKKDKGDETTEEAGRSRLFGSRSSKPKTSSPAPASSNPYATPQTAAGNPYAAAPQNGGNPYATTPKSSSPNPYAQSSKQSSYGNSSGAQEMHRTPSSSTQPPAYEATGYGGGPRGNDRYNNPGDYGAPRGYGSDRFGGSSETSSVVTSGYGGLGRPMSQETLGIDDGRQALFGGAKERFQQRQEQDTLPPEEDPNKGYGGGYGAEASSSYGYGNSQDSQLTAEQAEEEDVNATKDQIRDLKRQDVAETRNAIRIAAQAEETGRATLERLGLQGERIHNAERNLDLSANQNRLADEKYREIKRLNRSMFAPNVSNPFTKARRQRDMDSAVMDQHHKDKAQREATRAAAYDSMSRQQEAQRKLRREGGEEELSSQTIQKKKGANMAERSKYQFEADSEDEQMEDEIDANLDELSGAAGRLNVLGRAIGQELTIQNQHVVRIAGKVDKADDELEMLRAKLNRIK